MFLLQRYYLLVLQMCTHIDQKGQSCGTFKTNEFYLTCIFWTAARFILCYQVSCYQICLPSTRAFARWCNARFTCCRARTESLASPDRTGKESWLKPWRDSASPCRQHWARWMNHPSLCVAFNMFTRLLHRNSPHESQEWCQMARFPLHSPYHDRLCLPTFLLSDNCKSYIDLVRLCIWSLYS